MSSVVLILHLLIAIGLIILVLLQRSEGGALGMGGGSSSLMSGRGAADALARGTGVLAAMFFLTSISLTLLSGSGHPKTSVVDEPAQPSIFDTIFPKKAAPPPVTAPAPAPATPILPAPAPASDVIPPPAEAMQHAGPLEGPNVATLPPLAAAPVSAKPAVSLAKPPVALAAATPKSAAPPLAAASSSKPAVSAASAKPPLHSSKPATAGGESAQPAPPPSRAGPDE